MYSCAYEKEFVNKRAYSIVRSKKFANKCTYSSLRKKCANKCTHSTKPSVRIHVHVAINSETKVRDLIVLSKKCVFTLTAWSKCTFSSGESKKCVRIEISYNEHCTSR